MNKHGGSSIDGAEYDEEMNLTKGLVFLVWGEVAAKRINHSPIPSVCISFFSFISSFENKNTNT